MEIKPLYTIAEVARMLQVSRSTVERMVDNGDLDVSRLGKKRFVTLSGLQAQAAVWESIMMAQSYRG